MIDEKDQLSGDLPEFRHAISVEQLKEHDPSVTWTCERLGGVQAPPGLWRKILAWLGSSGGKA